MLKIVPCPASKEPMQSLTWKIRELSLITFGVGLEGKLLGHETKFFLLFDMTLPDLTSLNIT